MFDISWSEILILGAVTLIFVGPKDLPRFLNMLGRYAGVARRHALEFRQYFDDAMREIELQDMKEEVEKMRTDIENSVRAAEKNADVPAGGLPSAFAAAAQGKKKPELASPAASDATANAEAGSAPKAEGDAVAKAEPAAAPKAEPAPASSPDTDAAAKNAESATGSPNNPGS